MWPCIFCEQFLQPRSYAFYGTLRTHKVDANDIGMVVSAESVDCAPVWQVRRFTRSICQVFCFEKRRPTSHEGISCTCKISEFIPSQFLVSSGDCNWGLMRSLRPLRWTKSKSKGHWRDCVCRIPSLAIWSNLLHLLTAHRADEVTDWKFHKVSNLRFEKCEGSLQARKHLKNTSHTRTKSFCNSTHM